MFPSIEHRGDVFKADFTEFSDFDYLVGGSPCTYWSIAQKNNRETEASGMDYPYLDGDLGTIDGKATPVEPETIGQFTGLIDKNGQKVFEGDMVVSYDLFGSVDACGVVNWNDLFCAWHIGKNSMYGNRIATYEVIGNIHDSPEPHATKILTREE